MGKRPQPQLQVDARTGEWRKGEAEEGRGSEPCEPGGLCHQAGGASRRAPYSDPVGRISPGPTKWPPGNTKNKQAATIKNLTIACPGPPSKVHAIGARRLVRVKKKKEGNKTRGETPNTKQRKQETPPPAHDHGPRGNKGMV